ncbi:MAG: amidohydrolase family protein [Bryobacteraceae bacterium]|nr:amidohydrolase family protein [Bryobacteraceae bacterium]
MRNGFHIFDAHTHIGAAWHNGRTMSADDLLRNMDEHGIDRSLVIPFPVVEEYRRQHDLIGRAVKQHPDRLTGAACLDPRLPGRQFQDEIRRCREVYGFRAIKLQPQYHGLDPMSDSSHFFFETAVENRLPVIWHTGAGVPFALPSLCMAPARQFPELTLVVAHCGGGVFVQEAVLAALFCPNISLELSSLMPHQVLEVLAKVPPDRLMIGSDLPENTEVEIGKILGLPVPDADKRFILSGTAYRVFGQEP